MASRPDSTPADDLGAASTVRYQRPGRQRQPKRRPEKPRPGNESGIVSVYEPHVRYVPPLRPYLRELWGRRAFIGALAQSKVRSTRANTALGPLWAILDPLFQVGIYYFLFTVIRGGNRPPEFLPMLIFGVMHFQVSAAALNEGGNSVTGGRQLMLNSTFPRALLPIAAITGGLIKFVPSIAILALALVLLDAKISLDLLWWPALLALQLLIGLGLALLVSTLVVFFRDVKNLLTYVSRIMFFTAPVIYPVGVVPASIESVVRWGPIYGLFANYQRMVTGRGIDFELLSISLAWAVGGILLGGWVFLRFEREFGRKI